MITERRIYIFLLVVIIAIILWSSALLENLLLDAASTLEIYIKENPVLGVLIFIGLGIISTLLSFFTSIPLVPIAVLIWGASNVFLMLMAGWLMGSIISYYIGAYAGYPIIRHVVPTEKLEVYQEKVSRRTPFWIIYLFRLSLPAEIPGYILGIIRYKFWKYFLATFLAELPFALIAAYASDAFIAKNKALFFFWIIITLIIIFFSFRAAQKKFKNL